MDDPLSPLTAPPPRYLLESDSSDEEGQGLYPSTSSPRASKSKTYEVNFVSPSGSPAAPLDVEEVVVGVGQAGKYLARKAGLRNRKSDLTINVRSNGKAWIVGEGWSLGSSVLLSLREGDDHALAWKMAQAVKSAVNAKRWTIVTTYVPAMYNPDPDHAYHADQEAPIRSLTVSPSGMSAGNAGDATWESPNYLTGIAAALGSLAGHPASQFNGSLSILVTPLPFSSLSPSYFTSAITAHSPQFTQNVNQAAQRSHGETSWSEADDEPFSAPGMGAGKNRSAAKGEVGTMYL